MATVDEKFLRSLLQACAARAPEPLYPVRFAKAVNLDRDLLDAGLDELRRRGLVQFTEWVKDAGQGYALTDAGQQAMTLPRLPSAVAAPDLVERAESNEDERAEVVLRGVFAPTPSYATFVLLAANILFFAYGAIYAGQHDLSVSEYLEGRSKGATAVLIDLGALHPVLVFQSKVIPGARPQFERIILFFFLHVGLFHLAMNMYFLYAIGRLIESMWGSLRFLAIYFIAGIVSGCVILLMDTPLTAGASGSLYGIFVAMIVWFSFNKEYLPEGLIQAWSRNLAVNAFLLIGINFLPGMNISWQGHLGGAIGGLLAALLLHANRFHPSAGVRLFALAALPLVPLGFFLAVLWQAGWI